MASMLSPFGEGGRTAIVVGIRGSEKCNPPEPLKWPEIEASELTSVLRSESCKFLNVIPLIGSIATASEIIDTIVLEKEKIGEQDTFLFYFNGHGMPISTDMGGYEIFLVTSDFNKPIAKQKPDRYISLKSLRDLLYFNCKAKQVIVILDCCYSGEFDRLLEDAEVQKIITTVHEYFDTPPRNKAMVGGLRQALTASSHDAKAFDTNSMTRRLLPLLKGLHDIPDGVDTEGYVSLSQMYIYLQKDMKPHPPNLPGDPAGQHALLAFHPHLAAVNRERHEQKKRDALVEEFQALRSQVGELTDALPFTTRQISSFDQAVVHEATIQSLFTKDLEIFCSAERLFKQSEYKQNPNAAPEELIRRFGLVRGKKSFLPIYAAVLCFVDEPRHYVEGAYTRCIVYSGTDNLNAPLDDETFSQSLLTQFKESIQFLRRNLRLRRNTADMEAPDQWEIPFEAIREALANAYIHREYDGSTDGIFVEIFSDRIVISNPGHLAEGMNIEELVAFGRGKLRNAKLARIFYICGFVETLGSGINRLQDALQKANLEPATFEQINRKGLKRFEVTISRPNMEGVAQGSTEALQAITVDTIREIVNQTIGIQSLPQPFIPRPLPTPAEIAAALERLDALPVDQIPSPQDSLPSGSWMGQLHRNRQFIGRETDLLALARVLKGGTAVAIHQAQSVVTSGMGGIGKTQLAVEFSYRYGQYFAGVFWLNFAQTDSINVQIARYGGVGYLQLFTEAAGLKIDEQAALVRARWACGLPYLLVFDNCEEPDLVRQYHPGGAVRVLITSRTPDWPGHLGVQRHALGVLSRAESVALLCQYRPILSYPDADVLAAELGDLPLALHLAGSFLSGPGKALTVERYLSELRSPRLFERLSLREQLPTGHNRDVSRTFALSYERLEPQDTEGAVALSLLARAAYLAPGDIIPTVLLRTTLETDAGDLNTQLMVEAAIKHVIGLGLLEREGDSGIKMHRLVGSYVRQVNRDTEAQAAVERVVTAEAQILIDVPTLASITAFLPILRAVTDEALLREDVAAAALATWLGRYLEWLGSYAAALPYVEHALAIRERMLGAEHPYTASSLNNLARLYQSQGHYDSARPLYEQALAVRERTLGTEHPDTTSSLNDLAALYYAQGHYDVARPLYERALALRERALGAEHPDTAQSLNNLAALYYAQGHYDMARPLYERALALREHALGAEHPDTAQSLSNLAGLHYDQGNYDAAHPLYKRALVITERVLGAEHPQTTSSLNNLASLYQAQGDYGAARSLYERALAITERVLGAEHPQIAVSLNNLAINYYYQGQFEVAANMMQRSIAIYELRLGLDHPNTKSARQSLAAIEQMLIEMTEMPSIDAILNQLTQQADTAMVQAFAEGTVEQQKKLAQQFSDIAEEIERNNQGDNWIAVSVHLHTLAKRLRETP
jgi:tetratricopeptide (TPR) repeat protein